MVRAPDPETSCQGRTRLIGCSNVLYQGSFLVTIMVYLGRWQVVRILGVVVWEVEFNDEDGIFACLIRDTACYPPYLRR
jgi:hypothetical protein